MKAHLNLAGKRFARLVAISLARMEFGSGAFWNCKCDCGNECVCRGYSLRVGLTRSCGCYQREKAAVTIKTNHLGNKKHGKSRTKAYHAWAAMISRCTRPWLRSWKDYGGRGIKVCERWLVFENFLEDMGNPEDRKLQLDRRDNNGNYEPSNCRWVYPITQMQNTRKTVLLTFRGETLCIAALARKYGISKQRLRTRLQEWGWSLEKALLTPTRKYVCVNR